MSKINKSEIDALIDLLDDPEEEVFLGVRGRILTIGDPMIKPLETSWEEANRNDLFRNRVEGILQQINLASVINRLTAWVQSQEKDLLDGVLIVARHRYPDLDEGKVRAKLATMSQDIQSKLHKDMGYHDKVRTINRVVFEKHGLKRGKGGSNAAHTNYINNILATGIGSPVGLAVVYQLLAEGSGIPIKGVNLPNHFMVGYTDEAGNNPTKVLFYINVFDRGSVLQRSDIVDFLQKTNIPQKERYFMPCDNVGIILRLLSNLIDGYGKMGNETRVEELKTLRNLLGKNPEAE